MGRKLVLNIKKIANITNINIINTLLMNTTNVIIIYICQNNIT